MGAGDGGAGAGASQGPASVRAMCACGRWQAEEEERHRRSQARGGWRMVPGCCELLCSRRCTARRPVGRSPARSFQPASENILKKLQHPIPSPLLRGRGGREQMIVAAAAVLAS